MAHLEPMERRKAGCPPEMWAKAQKERDRKKVCPGCGRKLLDKIFWKVRWENNGQDKVFDGYTLYPPGYDDLWCTLRCATRFATAAHKAGYRLKKSKPQP